MKRLIELFQRSSRSSDAKARPPLPEVAPSDKTDAGGSWWERSLSWDEQNQIEDAFRPMGSMTARQMVESGSPHSIGNLVGHLKKEDLRHLGYLLIRRGDELIDQDTSVRAKHFFYAAAGEFHYRFRDLDDFALARAIEFFQRQIAIAAEMAAEFSREEDLGFIPGHAGYRQLRIILEKQGRFAEARALCLQAKGQGWQDDWDKQIARIDKKAGRRSIS